MASIPLNRLPVPGVRPQMAQAAPRVGFMGRIRNNSDVLMNMGAGLLAGRTGPEQFAMGLQGASGALDARDERRKRNQTIEWMRQNAPDFLVPYQAGEMTLNEAFTASQRARAPQGVRRSLNPIYGTDAQNNQVLLQVTDQGTLEQMAMPDGVSLSTGVDRVDAGTHFVLIDKRTGQAVGTIPKENYQEGFDSARGSAEGKAMGGEAAVLRDMQGNMPGLESTMDELRSLSDTATFTLGGQARDFAVRQMGGTTPGALARTQYEAIVNNQILPLLRQTFGAQFTVEEGRQLRATLGDPNKSPSEKQAVLEAFIAQKRRDLEAQQVRAGVREPAAATPTPPQGGGARRLRYNPQTGELE
jgi:hypothetical protein